jgi:3-(3-hydroxy-phenyl)propionate hydroxylase
LTRPLIAVVGAGPVGSLAALELARHGLRVLVLEARDEISWTSRAICISRRSLEILDRAGVGETFARKGLPWSKGKTFHRDRLVFRLEMPHSSEDAHAPFINLQQCHTEQFLIEAISSMENGPELRFGQRVTGVDADMTGVRLHARSDQGESTVEADWVVAADGARSIVRSSLGLAMHGTSYEGRYLISDIEVEGASWPVERHVWFDAPANPGSTVILHVQPDGIWRIDMQLHEDEDPELALRDENLLARLQAQLDMIGVTAPWRLVWKSVYRAHSLSLDSYRHGRVLFAGDAAHLVPIFGVRGLNSGFDDAHNLAWKLAMVARGQAPDALLDSYSAERRRATAENIANAEKSTWFMSPPSAGFRRMRDAALLLAHEHEWVRKLINPRQSSFHVYEGSPIIVEDSGPQTGVRPGAPIPNLPFRGTHLQRALSPLGFSALVFRSNMRPEQITDLASACGELGIDTLMIEEHERGIAEAFASHEFPVYLIRPDEHVAARFAAVDIRQLPKAFAFANGRAAGQTAVTGEVRVSSAIEDIYETLCRAVDRARAAGDDTALERIALTLAGEIGDAVCVRDLIETALDAGAEAPPEHQR